MYTTNAVYASADSAGNLFDFTAGGAPSIEFISLIIAFVAVVFGPAIQLYIARRQVKANVVSQNRQEWLNDLRNNIGELVSQVILLKTCVRHQEKYENKILDIYGEIFRLEAVIKLQLTGEKEQTDFIHQMEKVTDLSTKEGPVPEMNREIEELVRLGKIIVGKVWRQIEKME